MRTSWLGALGRAVGRWHGGLRNPRIRITFPPTVHSQQASVASHLRPPRYLPRLSHSRQLSKLPRRNFTSYFRSRSGNGKGKPELGQGATSTEPLSLTARLKKLSREYGWVAIGVYIGLSVLDLPFCFLLVRAVGTDKIGEIEERVISSVKSLIPQVVQDKFHDLRVALRKFEKKRTGDDMISDGVEMAGWGVEEASERYKAEASLGTQLALTYAIHKSFIFVRIPLAVGITPKVVKVLRGWGWQIGKRQRRSRRR